MKKNSISVLAILDFELLIQGLVVLGVGICWDQWFPEAARAMALMGAEILLYPTAIGSELDQPDFDSKNHWQSTMRGHAAANIMPVIASNRIGKESSNQSLIGVLWLLIYIESSGGASSVRRIVIQKTS